VLWLPATVAARQIASIAINYAFIASLKLEQVADFEMSPMGLECPLREQNGPLDCFCNGAKSEGPWGFSKMAGGCGES